MPIITLTTDWKKSDFYIGAIKGKLLRSIKNVTIVDISHQIQTFNIQQAAFILRNCFYEYPKGTVHIIAVNSAITIENRLLVIQYNDHYFITSDNGIPGLLFKDKVEDVYQVALNGGDENTFASLNLYVSVATSICDGKEIDSIGKKLATYKSQVPFRPVIEQNLINGSVIYIDSFSNAISNISQEVFNRVSKNRSFEILVQSNHYRINTINKTYTESASGDLLALFNSVGLLEIAICNGNVAELLNLKVNSTIRIRFFNKEDIPSLQLKGE